MSGLQENENSSFDFEYWYMEQQGQPFHTCQLNATTNRTSNTFSPSTLLSMSVPLCEGPIHALDQAFRHAFFKG